MAQSLFFFISSLILSFTISCNTLGLSTQEESSSKSRIQLIPSISGQTNRTASSKKAGLFSFQVAVADIVIAKSLTTNGSGFSALSGAFTLFSQDIGNYTSIDTTVARDPLWRSHYIDFCDQKSLSRITSSKSFTIRDTGNYHWAVINWAPFFRVRAAIQLTAQDTVYTQDGYIARYQYPNMNGNDAFYYVTEATKSLTTGPAEDAVVRKNNGGTWFRFLKPLRLSVADLDTGNTIADTIGVDSVGKPIIQHVASGKWNVLFVFNPDDLLYAGGKDSSNGSISKDISAKDSSAYIHVPFLKATAVPYRDGETVMRETYEFSVSIDKPWAQGMYGMRLELYLIGDNIVAATITTYPTDGKLAPPEVPNIFFVEEMDGGSLSLQHYDHTPVFNGFTRKASIGQSGTVQWDPTSMSQDKQLLQYNLTEIKRMN